MHVKDTPPYAPVLMESTRAIGYSLQSAIADIIDNSITARAGKVDVFFFPEDAYICILDNGVGMNSSEIDVAMQYGSQSPSEKRAANDLGRYGLGLKTASLSQCRVLTVISKQKDRIVGRRWDLDYVIQTGKWSLLVLDQKDIQSVRHIDTLMKMETGTLVLWENLDRLLNGNQNVENILNEGMDETRHHLELVFHRYLSGEQGIKKLEIFFNGRKLEPMDPFLMKKSSSAMAPETLVLRGAKAVITPYILPHVSKMTAEEKRMVGGEEGLRKSQGFYIYRNKRLLVWGTWFRLIRQDDLSKLARIMVDIPNDLDDLWTLDIKKSHAIPPDELRINLKAMVENMALRSKRTWTVRGKKEVSDNIEHAWNRLISRDETIIYEINRNHPFVTELIKAYPDAKNKLNTLLSFIENSLPTNQLYVDLNNDRKIKNDSLSPDLARTYMKEALANCTDEDEHCKLLERFEKSEPFCELDEFNR